MTEIINHRSGLLKLKTALKTDTVRLGFIGGSITQAAPGHNWPEFVSAWFKDTYPDKTIYAENIGIGATGSDLAAFRIDWELTDRNCDLIFVEYAVNDYEQPVQTRMNSREGLVRKLLSRTGADIVFVYTHREEFYKEMLQGGVPDSIAEFEALADHYDIGSVWMGRFALSMVERGLLRIHEWLPDGLHPQYAGSRIYAESVTNYIKEELTLDGAPLRRTTKALNPCNWEHCKVVPFEEIKKEGPWIIKSNYTAAVGHVLYTSAFGVKLSFGFKGRGFTLGNLFGKICGEFRWRVNGGEWQVTERASADWAGDCGWYNHLIFIESEKEQDYSVEIETVRYPSRTGCSNFYITHVGIF